MGRFGRRWVWMVVALCFDAGSVTAQEVLHVYGPGGRLRPCERRRRSSVEPPAFRFR